MEYGTPTQKNFGSKSLRGDEGDAAAPTLSALSPLENRITIASRLFKYGETREGDVPHSLASIEKGNSILGYKPKYSVKKGLEVACEWYYKNLK